ncbi:MAG: helix-turn-helix transcriptional regulator [Acidobacteriota bacterium]
MDIVLRLRELRRLRGLSQKDVAVRSGVGEKTISSFETGERVESLKVSQLRRLLSVYGMTEREFFGGTVEQRVAPWEAETDSAVASLAAEMKSLSLQIQRSLMDKFRLMVDTAADVHHLDDRPQPFRSDSNPEWQMLTSRN